MTLGLVPYPDWMNPVGQRLMVGGGTQVADPDQARLEAADSLWRKKHPLIHIDPHEMVLEFEISHYIILLYDKSCL